VYQNADWSTDGDHSLRVDTTGEGWFGAVTAGGVDISGKTTLKYDIKTVGAGTNAVIAFQTGDGWAWCESSWGWVGADVETTVEIDLFSLPCTGGLDDIKAVHTYLKGSGTFFLDNFRAE
jgi:mannan endo-1,4-beta-mannosidase